APQVERLWGHARFVVIYLLSAFVGACWAVAHVVSSSGDTGYTAGASGAICGLLAADGVFFLLNRRYMPRDLVSRWSTNIMGNLVAVVAISLLPGVSWSGHLGGAIGGALAALVLSAEMFAPAPWRWLALVGLLPIPLAGTLYLDHVRKTSPGWAKLIERWEK